ncbi:hypothetical protein [Corynebacterium cystitidis]|uniref:Membrane protein involved in the export of O-antigen and teichoic acid n=1 Tax=Corynebacterium cystitidis DSM 20524 TaxID=1121357 RepID=A0A1H9VZQ5_9CORY|nr:hypothetical protein [Corynebacterium cystitidis]WJY81323.1 hypothetical protein CCYS_01750 [Corynebacterium cystitidis DSM 20524]SES26753.1 hypothetical protein SAMN05661109_02451 [Corynebacterium cystitidis DSM 20524]SNV88388.1 hypothetical membrane protein [Corynebacterium cystitidis]
MTGPHPGDGKAGGVKALSLATIFAALSGFVVIWVAQWPLDAETQLRYFQAYWGLFFASAGVIDGITQETTRAVAARASQARTSQAQSAEARECTASRQIAKEGGAESASPWRFGAVVATVVFTVVLVASFFIMTSVVPPSPGLATGLLAFGLVSYVFQAVLSGILSGANLWGQYASLVALDSGVRLALALVAWGFGWGLEAFLLITVIGTLSWVAVLVGSSSSARAAIGAQLDVAPGPYARRVLQAMLASGANAALITGYPTFLNAAFPQEDPTTTITIAGVINAVTLTRAPILVPLQRFQSMLVVKFVEAGRGIYRALAKPVAAVLGLGVLGFVAAWLVGPWILKIAFKPELFVNGLTLGLLTFASALTGSLMITGTAVLALEQHGWYVAGWLVASAVAYLILFFAPLGLLPAVIVSLMAGPMAGAVVHLLGLGRARRIARS